MPYKTAEQRSAYLREWKRQNPDKVRAHRRAWKKRHPTQHRKERYDLTNAEFQAILTAQMGLCAICQEPMMKPYVDHDHETGLVRGLVHHGCNVGLGMLGDSVAGLEAALAYLRRAA